jgi:hypothetical protein
MVGNEASPTTAALLGPGPRLPAGLVRRLDRAQRRFLAQRSVAIAHRACHRQIVDGQRRPAPGAHLARATLRAGLMIAHLLAPNVRTPQKWPQLARTHLRLAADDA